MYHSRPLIRTTGTWLTFGCRSGTSALHGPVIIVVSLMPKSTHTLADSRRMKAKSSEALAAQEQRVGKVEKYTRTTGPIERPRPKLRRLNETEKRIRALNKKLRDIEAIREREKAGETLDDQQLAKLDSLGHVLADLESLITG